MTTARQTIQMAEGNTRELDVEQVHQHGKSSKADPLLGADAGARSPGHNRQTRRRREWRPKVRGISGDGRLGLFGVVMKGGHFRGAAREAGERRATWAGEIRSEKILKHSVKKYAGVIQCRSLSAAVPFVETPPSADRIVGGCSPSLIQDDG